MATRPLTHLLPPELLVRLAYSTSDTVIRAWRHRRCASIAKALEAATHDSKVSRRVCTPPCLQPKACA
jgi:hypothetical protein